MAFHSKITQLKPEDFKSKLYKDTDYILGCISNPVYGRTASFQCLECMEVYTNLVQAEKIQH